MFLLVTLVGATFVFLVLDNAAFLTSTQSVQLLVKAEKLHMFGYVLNQGKIYPKMSAAFGKNQNKIPQK